MNSCVFTAFLRRFLQGRGSRFEPGIAQYQNLYKGLLGIHLSPEGPSFMQATESGERRQTILTVIGIVLAVVLAPVMAYGGALLSVSTAELLSWHGLFRWATSLGDIGQALGLMLGGAAFALLGWLLGFAVPFRRSIAARACLAGVPSVILGCSWGTLLLPGRAAIPGVCLGGVYGLCLLLGALVRSALDGVRNRGQPSLPVRRRWLAWAIIASPFLIAGGGLLGLHLVHAIQAAGRERACLECIQVIIQAKRQYYQSRKTIPTLVELEGDPAVADALRRSGGYRFSMPPGSRAIQAMPENAAKWQNWFWIERGSREVIVKKNRWMIGSDRIQEDVLFRQRLD